MTPDQQKVLEEKKLTLLKACHHLETDYIPNFSHCANAILDYAGVSFSEAEADEEKCKHVFSKLLGDMRLDVGMLNYSGWPLTHETLGGRTETFLAPDGVTLQHLQQPIMGADEYPLFMEDLDGFIKNVLLPRKYPALFEDKEAAMTSLKIVASEAASRLTGHYSKVRQMACEEHGFLPLPIAISRFRHPADYIFDRFRGFAGTLSDIRRKPAEFKAAVDKIYYERTEHFLDVGVTDDFVTYMPHLAPYLNYSQFMFFFWPYFERIAYNLALSGNRVYMSLENRWLPFIDTFLDLPHGTVVAMADDDDIFELNKIIGYKQILTGGVLLQNTRLLPVEKNIDYAKRVIDECAPGGGFLFNSNKAWVCKGDINQTLVDVYNFAHDYGRK
ncbi:MAG: hypothetical protein FWG10_01640 [Eubacteriaceae bacterium]|nr:hypothetical protein [Eubacteriaceae bacterium]